MKTSRLFYLSIIVEDLIGARFTCQLNDSAKLLSRLARHMYFSRKREIESETIQIIRLQTK